MTTPSKTTARFPRIALRSLALAGLLVLVGLEPALLPGGRVGSRSWASVGGLSDVLAGSQAIFVWSLTPGIRAAPDWRHA